MDVKKTTTNVISVTNRDRVNKLKALSSRTEGIVISATSLSTEEYFANIFFSAENERKVWSIIEGIKISSISRSYILNDRDDDAIKGFVMRLRATIGNYCGQIVNSYKVSSGICLLDVTFDDQLLMTAWETSVGIY